MLDGRVLRLLAEKVIQSFDVTAPSGLFDK